MLHFAKKLKPIQVNQKLVSISSWLQSDPLHLWLCLVAAAPLYHLVLLISVRAPLPLIIFSLVLWAVAWLPLEDALESLHFFSSRRPGFLLGCCALTLLVLRGSQVQRFNDPFLVILPFALALALFLLCRPCADLGLFREELFTLSLLPIITWLPPIIPEQWLSKTGALSASVFLQLFGVDAIQVGTSVSIGSASVRVAGPCSGNEMIAQAVVVAFLALISFPLPIKHMRALVFLLAPLLAWMVNSLRISLLAVIALLKPESAISDTGVFHFFHLGEGGMIFSSIGIGLFAWIYVTILDRQLRATSH
jgi:exosortase/archaeosortase family protein